MAKLLIRATGLLLLGVVSANVALAQNAVVDTHMGPNYAAELFGPGSNEVVLEYMVVAGDTTVSPPVVAVDEQPKIKVVLGSNVTAGSGATLSITLDGAVFADPVRPRSHLLIATRTTNVDSTGDTPVTTYTYAPDNTKSVTVNSTTGGAAGDSMVSFEIEAATALAGDSATTTDASTDDAIVFALPPVTEAAAAMGFLGKGVRATISLTSASSADGAFPDFPTSGQLMPGTNRRETGKRVVIPPAYTTGGLVPSAALSIVGDQMSVETGRINVKDRTRLGGLPATRSPVNLRISSVTISLDQDLRQADGEGFSIGRRGGGSGEVTVSVLGNVREGDMVIFDMDGDGKADDGEMLDIDGGIASGDFDLDELLPVGDDDIQTTSATGTVLYFPQAEGPLRAGSLITTYSVTYDEETNGSAGFGSPSAATGMPSVSALTYGSFGTIKAYAIAPMSSGDESNIRIRCGSSVPCTVYVACDSADGTDYFGQSNTIHPWSVDTLNAMELADVIGADDADFAGRLSCEVIGGALTVQVLTRSGGALVNNTYVGQ